MRFHRNQQSNLHKLGKGILKICSKFTGEHPCRSVISIKLLCNFIEITLRHGCFPDNLLHIFRTSLLKNTSGWLLLNIMNTLTGWLLLNLMKTLLLLTRHPPCLTIPLNSTVWELNSTNCDEGDDLLKIKLDEQLKEIRKCHHQKYLNTNRLLITLMKFIA